MFLKDPFPSPSLIFIPDFYASLLQTSLKSNNPVFGKSVHARIIKAGLQINVFLMNNLINFYAKSGSLSDAHRLFDDMPLKNTFSWNTILSVYAKQGRIDTACQFFKEMPQRDSVSWTAMIAGYNQMGCFEDAIRMFLEMNSSGVPPTQFTFTNILASCVAIEALDIGVQGL
ncbi:hypothetical protein NE237_029885 [Protea cynaroides]|uniref:Pentatricopeptide repeat-containing protein n=1 Tax=Protea cynaroides TaxID=273540 RepID=A0A9Q0GSN5_9MAGN|nr:hypothetical protein NE237_029885 [Protea cynaroides]